MQDLLRVLAAQLSTVDGQVDVLYALTPVVDGQALSGRLLLRLPHATPATRPGRRSTGRTWGGWWPRPWPGRSGRAGGRRRRTTRLSDDTVVTLDLVRRPAAAPELVPIS